MGMYDCIHDMDLCCPYCGEPATSNIQTKDLECMLNHYTILHRDDMKDERQREIAFMSEEEFPRPSDQLKYITGIQSCNSYKCKLAGKAFALRRWGHTCRECRVFSVRYDVIDGVAVGPATVIELDDNMWSVKTSLMQIFHFILFNEWAREKFLEVWKENGYDFGLAALEFHWNPHLSGLLRKEMAED